MPIVSGAISKQPTSECWNFDSCRKCLSRSGTGSHASHCAWRCARIPCRHRDRRATPGCAHPVRHKDKSCKGFNFFEPKDRMVLMAIAHPSSDISGFRRKSLTKAIPGMTPHQASYYLKRLKLHELIKKEPRSHTYSLTYLGRRAATTFVHLEQLAILPLLAG